MIILKITIIYIILKLIMKIQLIGTVVSVFLMSIYAPIIVASGPIRRYINNYKIKENFLFYNILMVFYHIIFSLCLSILHEIFFKQFIQTHE